jgi:hypothetical protein
MAGIDIPSGGGGGIERSSICCNVADEFLSSINSCDTISNLCWCFVCVSVGVACEIARCKSFSKDTISRSQSSLDFETSTNLCCNDSSCSDKPFSDSVP